VIVVRKCRSRPSPPEINGTFWLKPRRGKTFSLPAGVTGDVKRDCATALILYWMEPILEDQIPG